MLLVNRGYFVPLNLYQYLLKMVADNNLVVFRDLFGDIVNLFLHLELLMYSKTLEFLVDSTNMYGGIFYQIYILPWLTIPF